MTAGARAREDSTMSEAETTLVHGRPTALKDPGVASRRAFFRGLSTMAGLWGAAAAAKAAVPPSAVSADVDPGSLLSKLVRRITMGANQEELALANTLGYSGYLEYHLNHTAIDDSV